MDECKINDISEAFVADINEPVKLHEDAGALNALCLHMSSLQID